MLGEIKETRQVTGEGKRRWFRDDHFDLIVWYDGDREISGFQLCYDKFDRERAITWRRGGSFEHTAVDDGESAFGGPKMTPIMIADGEFDHEGVAALFREQSREIDLEIATVVLETLARYPTA